MAQLAANVLITAGPTREFLDDVRFISNPSTGLMGVELANAAKSAGASVSVVCGPTNLQPVQGVHWVPVVSAQDMLGAVSERFDECDVFIASAAVGDYRAKERAQGKVRKGPKQMTIELEKNPDILLRMGKRKQPGQILVGYSLEVENPLKGGRRKLQRKNCDLMVVNTPKHFGDSTEHIRIIDARGLVAELPPSSKAVVAQTVIDLVAKLHAGEVLSLIRGFEQ
jgi:phosphopantothenoylcysteine decarboxylase/phosphopantothenate--cysteine ligase